MTNSLIYPLLLLVLLGPVTGCHPPPPKNYPSNAFLAAKRVEDPPTQPDVAASAQTRVTTAPPPQLKLLPPPDATTAKPAGSPLKTVEAANRTASKAPDSSSYFNAIVQYAYEPGTLYQVYAAPLFITDIVLEPGEKLTTQPATGDVVRWVLGIGKSLHNGAEQTHIYVKPTREGLHTNLAINTNRRTYLLDLKSFEETHMAAVTWHYPQDDLARLQQQATEIDALSRNAAPVVSLDRLNFDYAVHVMNGEPSWTPVQVFDDGRHTFVRFPATMRTREAPALFVLRDRQMTANLTSGCPARQAIRPRAKPCAAGRVCNSLTVDFPL